MASYKGLPNVLIVMFALIALFVFLTTSTTFGRRIYAIGGNLKAAKLSGINTERMNFWIFTIMGALAGLAGLVFAARLNVATPKAGLGFELDVIAACFIGGAATTGGVGKVIGAVIGAFIMGVMNNGMSIMGIGIDWQQVIKGAVLLLAVFLDNYYKQKAGLILLDRHKTIRCGEVFPHRLHRLWNSAAPPWCRFERRALVSTFRRHVRSPRRHAPPH